MLSLAGTSSLLGVLREALGVREVPSEAAARRSLLRGSFGHSGDLVGWTLLGPANSTRGQWVGAGNGVGAAAL